MIRIFDIPFHSMSSEVKKFALSSETDYTLFHFGSNDIRWVDRGLSVCCRSPDTPAQYSAIQTDSAIAAPQSSRIP